MTNQSASPAPNDPGKRSTPKRTYRVVQKPARPGTISDEQALQAVRAVKQLRLRTRTA